MTPRLSGHSSIFGLVLFVLKSLLGIAKQSSREKFEILSLNPKESCLNFNISNVGFYGTHFDSSSLLASKVQITRTLKPKRQHKWENCPGNNGKDCQVNDISRNKPCLPILVPRAF